MPNKIAMKNRKTAVTTSRTSNRKFGTNATVIHSDWTMSKTVAARFQLSTYTTTAMLDTKIVQTSKIKFAANP